MLGDAGKLQTRRDVYNIDGRLIAAVKSERAIIELRERFMREVGNLLFPFREPTPQRP